MFFPYTQVQEKKKDEVNQKKKGCCKGRFFSISNCFAAGMLLAMALCHILPEAESMYQALMLSKEKAAETVPMEAHDDHDDHEEEGHEEHEEEGHEEHEEEGHEEEGHEGHEKEGHEGHADHEGEVPHRFPLVYTLFFGGFMVMLVLDQVIFKPSQKLFHAVKKNQTAERHTVV